MQFLFSILLFFFTTRINYQFLSEKNNSYVQYVITNLLKNIFTTKQKNHKLNVVKWNVSL